MPQKRGWDIQREGHALTEKELMKIAQDYPDVSFGVQKFVRAGINEEEAKKFLEENFQSKDPILKDLVPFLRQGNELVRKAVEHEMLFQQALGEVY